MAYLVCEVLAHRHSEHLLLDPSGPSVCRLVGRSKRAGQKVMLPCSYRSTCFTLTPLFQAKLNPLSSCEGRASWPDWSKRSSAGWARRVLSSAFLRLAKSTLYEKSLENSTELLLKTHDVKRWKKMLLKVFLFCGQHLLNAKAFAWTFELLLNVEAISGLKLTSWVVRNLIALSVLHICFYNSHIFLVTDLRNVRL